MLSYISKINNQFELFISDKLFSYSKYAYQINMSILFGINVHTLYKFIKMCDCNRNKIITSISFVGSAYYWYKIIHNNNTISLFFE